MDMKETTCLGNSSTLSALRLFCCALFAVLGCADRALAADGVDTVFLKNGGRVRGQVLESDPASRTRIQLSDGSIRVFQAAEVDRVDYAQPAPAAPPWSSSFAPSRSGAPQGAVLQGALRVESSEPGHVFLGGIDYGPTPQIITNLLAGDYRVGIIFHAGDSDTRLVTVRGGTETTLRFDATPSLQAFRAHEGFHFGAGIAAGVSSIELEDTGGAFRAFGRASYAFTRVFELRADLVLGLFPGRPEVHEGNEVDHYRDTAFAVDVRLDAQLNLSSIYTISFGFDFGGMPADGVLYGAHVSPLGFRIGPKRELLLALEAGALTVSDGDPSLDVTLGLSYLFL